MGIVTLIDNALMKADLYYKKVNLEYLDKVIFNEGEEIETTLKRTIEEKVAILRNIKILDTRCKQGLFDYYYDAHVHIENAILVYLNHKEGEEQGISNGDIIFLAKINPNYLEEHIRDLNLNTYNNTLDTNALLKRVLEFKKTGKLDLPFFQYYVFNTHKRKIVRGWNKRENAETNQNDFNKYSEDDQVIVCTKVDLTKYYVDPEINQNWEKD